MKLEDIEVGQTVVDKFGNEYVVEIVGSDSMPVHLRLTKFVKRATVQRHGVAFDSVDDCFWIYKSEKVAKKMVQKIVLLSNHSTGKNKNSVVPFTNAVRISSLRGGMASSILILLIF